MLYKSVNRCTLEWINKVLLYSTENYMQYLVINHNEKYEKVHICVCVCVCVLTESLCCTAKINTLSINYTSIKSIFKRPKEMHSLTT